jgi:hypothetical protein
MDDDTVKLNGQTKSGRRFSLLLKRQKTDYAENTAISVEWEKDADEEFWAIVLDLVVRPAPIADGAPVSTNGSNSGR